MFGANIEPKNCAFFSGRCGAFRHRNATLQAHQKPNEQTNMKTSTTIYMLAAAVAITAAALFAQSPAPQHSPHATDPATAQQLSNAQDKAAELNTTLAQNTSPGASKKGRAGSMGATPSPGMSPGMKHDSMTNMSSGGSSNMSGMGMIDDDDMMNMSGGNMSGMSSMMDMNKMEMAGMMGKMGGNMGAMEPSALPGFAGASHLYHIGATDFFLDHPQHITLSTEQQVQLSKMREQAAMAKSAADRKVDQAEEELWQLTAADKPDISKIEAKVREIEKISGDARIAFIRAVGEAAKVLTDDQRKILTGFATPAPAATPMPMQPAPSPTMSPMSDM